MAQKILARAAGKDTVPPGGQGSALGSAGA